MMKIRKALVTGGGARLGKAMALALAEDGFDVAVHFYGSNESAEQTASEARSFMDFYYVYLLDEND